MKKNNVLCSVQLDNVTPEEKEESFNFIKAYSVATHLRDFYYELRLIKKNKLQQEK